MMCSAINKILTDYVKPEFKMFPSRKNEYNSTFYISFKLTWDLHIFIHMPGDEIWLSYFNFPLEVSYFQLDVNNTNGLRWSDIIITENEVIGWDKPKAPCNSYMLEVR
jgi:hypothetical protein